jgi:hypothetical protein
MMLSEPVLPEMRLSESTPDGDVRLNSSIPESTASLPSAEDPPPPESESSASRLWRVDLSTEWMVPPLLGSAELGCIGPGAARSTVLSICAVRFGVEGALLEGATDDERSASEDRTARAGEVLAESTSLSVSDTGGRSSE